MRAVGIIAEYNPFHNGHLLHVAEARRASGLDAVVAVMSGQFVQRGEPAVFDKWSRAEMAVAGGVDLVVELPVAFAVRSAQFFAAGGVRLLAALGVVDKLCFGAEHPDAATLSTLAAATEDACVTLELRRRLGGGETYAAALGRTLAAHTGLPAAVVASPNNILAVEYVRAIARYAPDMVPLPIARRGAGYHDTSIQGPIASATAVRQALLAGDMARAEAALPPASRVIAAALTASGRGPVSWEDFTPLALAALRRAPLAELGSLPEVSEGLEYKLKDAGREAGDAAALWALLKSKRYPRTRLQRLLVHALLASRKADLAAWDECGPLYARVLAFGDRGRVLLRAMESAARVPVVTKTTHFLDGSRAACGPLPPPQAMLALDVAASDLYCLGMANPVWRRGGEDFRHSPRYMPERR